MKLVALLVVASLVAISAVPHMHSKLKKARKAHTETDAAVGVMPANFNGALGTICGVAGAAPGALVDAAVEDGGFHPVTLLRAAMQAATNANTPESKVLAKVIADILLVTPKMISYNPFQAGAGATCVLRWSGASAFQGYSITYQGVVDPGMTSAVTNPNGIQDPDVIRTAQVMHELTHCRIHDVYGTYMMQYKRNPFPVVAAPTVGNGDLSANGCFVVGREAVFQANFLDVNDHNNLVTNAQALIAAGPAQWANRAVATKQLIWGKAQYILQGAANGLEYDAPLAQLLYLCFSYPRCRAKTAFYRKIAAMNEEVLCRRHLNSGRPKVALAAPTPNQDCTGY